MQGVIGALHVHVASVTHPHLHAFPRAVWKDDRGNAMSSWRMMLTYGLSEPPPFIEQAWNSPANALFVNRDHRFTVKDLEAPSQFTQVFALVGPGTADSEYKRGKGRDPDGFFIGFVDGSVWIIDKDVPREAISKFFTVENAAKYDRSDV